MIVSIDRLEAEDRYGREPVHELTPDRLFERRWATTVLDLVLARLDSEMSAAGKKRQFDVLRPALVVLPRSFLTPGPPSCSDARKEPPELRFIVSLPGSCPAAQRKFLARSTILQQLTRKSASSSPPSAIEPPRRQRPAGETGKGLPHSFQYRPRGGVSSEVVQLLAVISKDGTALREHRPRGEYTSSRRPQRTQGPAGLEHLRVGVSLVERNHLRDRPTGGGVGVGRRPRCNRKAITGQRLARKWRILL